MTGERDAHGSNQMEGNTEHLLKMALVRPKRVDKNKNCACKLGNFVLFT